jgi:hypothetical protein
LKSKCQKWRKEKKKKKEEEEEERGIYRRQTFLASKQSQGSFQVRTMSITYNGHYLGESSITSER